MNIKELLPIGSVIVLKGGTKRLMIYGIKQKQQNAEDKEYDYIGVIYPEGNIGLKGQFLFNHEDIEKVYFKGYEDAERDVFIKKLDAFYEQVDQKNQIL